MDDTLDRKALTIYLDDVRTMEMIIHQSKKRIERLKHEEKVWEQKEDEMEKYVASKYRTLDEKTNYYEFEKNNLENYLTQCLPAYPNKPQHPKFKTASRICYFIAIAFFSFFLFIALICDRGYFLLLFGIALFSSLSFVILANYFDRQELEYNNTQLPKYNIQLSNYNRIFENCKKEHHQICEDALKDVEKAKSDCNKAEREKENLLKEKMKFTTKKIPF